MTERTVLVTVGPLPSDMEPERQVSVPWCTVHNSPYEGYRPPPTDVECGFVFWGKENPTHSLSKSPCVIKDGVVWKVVKE